MKGKQPRQRRPARSRSKRNRLGVWLFGALGGLATTIVTGARAMAKGSEPHGLLTETDLFEGIALVPLENLVFGGHEIRKGDLLEAARKIQQETGTIPYPLLQDLEQDLLRVSADIRRGCLVNAGRSIQSLADRKQKPRPLRTEIRRLQRDIRRFMENHELERCVCVNLISTEPQLTLTRTHKKLEMFERALDRDLGHAVRPSAIYAYVSASLGLPFIHFTPSNAGLPFPILRFRRAVFWKM